MNVKVEIEQRIRVHMIFSIYNDVHVKHYHICRKSMQISGSTKPDTAYVYVTLCNQP